VIAEITPPSSGVTVSPMQLWQRVAAYTVGLVSATTLVGATAGTIGSLVQVVVSSDASLYRLWLASMGALAFAYGMHEMRIIRLPKPQIGWQVPAHWSRYGKTVQALLYGVVLGAEVFTLIPYASFYVLLVIEVCLGMPQAMILGCIYGLARALPTVTVIVRTHNQTNTLPAAMRIMKASGRFRVANGVALALVGEVLLAAPWLVK